MKKEVERRCFVKFKGDEKYKPFVSAAVDKFLEYVDCCYKFGFFESINVDVCFVDKEKKD